MQVMEHTGILLESGTNELEIMEFTIAGQVFGINVAKVREILKYTSFTPMQNAHPFIEGIFKPRDEVITIIDLAKYLNLRASEDTQRDIFMICAFNKMVFAFHVHSVVGIDRISWSKIQKPDKIIYGGNEGVATGIAEYDNRLITILDFEKIISEVSPQSGIRYEDLECLGQRERSTVPILVVEDSMLLAKMIIESLHRSGYINTILTDNGQEAWDYLCGMKNNDNPAGENIALVVSDIEMPRMDGLHLVKLIKSDNELKKIPVIMFSSLINEQMRLKCEQVGAEAQIAKPEITNLVNIIDRLIVDQSDK